MSNCRKHTIRLLLALTCALSALLPVSASSAEPGWDQLPDEIRMALVRSANLTAEVARIQYNISVPEQKKLTTLLIDRIEPLWNWHGCTVFFSEQYANINSDAETAADAVLGKCQQYARLVAIQEAAASRYAPYLYENSSSNSVYRAYLSEGRRKILGIILEKRTEP